MSNIIVAACDVSSGQSEGGAALPGYVSKQTARQRNMNGTATLDTAKAFIWDSLSVHCLLHHPIAEEDLVAKVKISLHKEEGAKFVDMDDPSLFFEDHLEARLPTEGGEAICEAKLDEDGMDFRQGGAGGCSLVVTKVETRIGGGCALPCLTPVGLKV